MIPRKHEAMYPGHPLTLAVIILAKYEGNIESAFAPKRDKGGGYHCPNALADNDIPGAGDCVYQALDLIRDVYKGRISPEKAIEHARKTWQHDRTYVGHADRLVPGQEQADALAGAFLTLARRVSHKK